MSIIAEMMIVEYLQFFSFQLLAVVFLTVVAASVVSGHHLKRKNDKVIVDTVEIVVPKEWKIPPKTKKSKHYRPAPVPVPEPEPILWPILDSDPELLCPEPEPENVLLWPQPGLKHIKKSHLTSIKPKRKYYKPIPKPEPEPILWPIAKPEPEILYVEPEPEVEVLILHEPGIKCVKKPYINSINQPYKATRPKDRQPVGRKPRIDGNVQPYCSSIMVADSTLYYLRNEILGFEYANLYQQTYIGLLLALTTAAQGLARGEDYDEAYSTVPIIFTVGQLMPETARDLQLKLYDDFNEATDTMRELVHEELEDCDDDVTQDDLEICNKKVDAIVRSNPALQDSAALVLVSAKFGVEYNSWMDKLDLVSKTNTGQQFLSKYRDDLRPLIDQFEVLAESLYTCTAY